MSDLLLTCNLVVGSELDGDHELPFYMEHGIVEGYLTLADIINLRNHLTNILEEQG